MYTNVYVNCMLSTTSGVTSPLKVLRIYPLPFPRPLPLFRCPFPGAHSPPFEVGALELGPLILM
jgi:hypothetical protein